jgi:hypothetical protein
MGSAGPYGFSDPLNIGVWFDSTSYASSYSGYLDSQGRAVINTSSGAGGHGNRVINTNLGVMGGPNSTVLEYSGAGNFLVEGNRAAGGSFLFVADSAGLLTLGDNDMTFTVWPYAQSYAALNKVVGGGTTFPASAPETVYPKTQQIIGSFIINGDMNIDQPHEGATFATCVGNSIVRLIDRWKCYNFNSGPTTAGTWQRITTGLTTYPYALQLTVSGTAVALAAGNQIHIDTGLEGGQFQLLGWGTNFGTPAVLDFCAKSSVTGTYGGWLRNTGGTFYYQFQYVISAANTWTCFSQNIPAPLGSGGFASPPINGSYYVYVGFDLGTGSTSNNATLGWTVPTSGTRVHLTGSVNLTNTANAVMAWTGVHLRAGTLQFAPYQQREFGDELNLVSRFYQKSFPPGIIPVQNGGLAGATCTTSQTATATSGRPNVYIRLNPAFQGAPAITTYNPAVADANWRDVTTTAASVPVSVDPSTAKSATGFQITSGATTSVLANDNICIHWSADTVGNEN